MSPLKGIRAVVTGEFGESRTSIAKKLVSLGATFMTTITNKTNLLITGVAAGEAKIKKARLLGIAIRDAAWLQNVFEKNGLRLEPGFRVDDV